MPSIPFPALYNACSRGDAAAVSKLLPAGGTPRDLSGPAFQSPATRTTPLMIAAAHGNGLTLVHFSAQLKRFVRVGAVIDGVCTRLFTRCQRGSGGV